jgi:uncharacterized membrane protein
MGTPRGGRWTDEGIESAIAILLRVGVLAAAALVLAGLVAALIRTGGDPVQSFATFNAAVSHLLSPTALLRGIVQLEPIALAQAGLLLLVATPVMRVAFSALGFVMQRDWAYVVITSIVLAVLALGLIGGVG